jgi:hypothetical protein
MFNIAGADRRLRKARKTRGKGEKDAPTKNARRLRKRKPERPAQQASGQPEAGRGKKRSREASASSSRSGSSSTEGEQERRAAKKQKRRRERSPSISSSEESSSSSGSSSSISSEEDYAGFTRKQARRAKRRFRAINRFWVRERRPDFLQTWQGCADFSVSEIQDMQSKMEKEAEKQNLGEDIFNRDSKPKKIKFKAQSDNGISKLHEAGYLRPPICQPKEYNDKIHQKRTEIIRNFPMEHYGMQGQVPDATIGRMHNRTCPASPEKEDQRAAGSPAALTQLALCLRLAIDLKGRKLATLLNPQ